jgi:hypothetical protein
MNKALLDLYVDYLISSFGATTATGLSSLLGEGEGVSHDKITRFLSERQFTSAELWQLVKPLVRQVQRPDGVLSVDDSIEEKPYTDENDLICWHYDHSKDRLVKGINFLSALYQVETAVGVGEVSLPVAFALITKTEKYIDKKSGKQRRRSAVSKNEHYRTLLLACVTNQIPFRYVLSDAWFASADNMKLIKGELNREFVMPLKSNRLVALSEQDKSKGIYQAVNTLRLEPGEVVEVYLQQVDFPLLLCGQLFKNEDGSGVTLYLVTSDLTLGFEQITSLYHRRWRIEEYHKSLKQNASLEKSPTRTEVTQTNHLFCALCAFVKLEWLKMSTHLNHFALRTRLYLSALKSAFHQLQTLSPVALGTCALAA